ncbi:hypothetical protein VFPPC_18242 [Pochonia chlamydosporia 170]|uniref:C2H2-type domain-containing protein n=1 Tax=Pochonia chlamydosporia 170 TaxID=1380566 RepID=A0A219AP53_METCM|nr:hypothetical protein VFPPC_18242 [Pochonia chlamydosporia 170]OWT42630.1 hypothetical protein VFPPC_18242 [Pochonia chlamydosporia 170]
MPYSDRLDQSSMAVETETSNTHLCMQPQRPQGYSAAASHSAQIASDSPKLTGSSLLSSNGEQLLPHISIRGEKFDASSSSSMTSTPLSSGSIRNSLEPHQQKLIAGSSRPQHICQRGCDKVFQSPKDLDRHYTTRAHATSSRGVYVCRCGYSNARKDHYCRHLAQMSCVPQRLHFQCICSEAASEADINEHRAHVKLCKVGSRARGRPRKTAVKGQRLRVCQPPSKR